MSEFQYVGFRAIDGPISNKNLEFMRQQSSRAEISVWSFDNEYHFGDFHGDAEEMLRRGYDIHLHYANFGIRKVMIRLPGGLPNAEAAAPYFQGSEFKFVKDKRGPAGILRIHPNFEPGDLDDLWDLDMMLDRLIPLRAEIMDGDLRPFYLAALAVGFDSYHDPAEISEAPIPAGLAEITSAQEALAQFYGISKSMLSAAAENAPPAPLQEAIRKQYADWLKRQSETTKNAWLAELLSDPETMVRRDILEQFRASQGTVAWPTKQVKRTLAELAAKADEIHAEQQRKSSEKAARDRSRRLAAMAADPTATLRRTEELIQQRTTQAYRESAELLAELREALAGSKRASLADDQARKLLDMFPTQNRLISELRNKGFIPRPPVRSRRTEESK